MAGMDHAGMDMHGMKGMLGGYSMMRDASGTAWQPDSSPMWAIMGKRGDWSTMVHGYATLVYDNQGGPRGDEKTFVASMFMGMAQRPLGGGTLTLKAMGSLDPLMGKSGYPLLLATGETADGRTELVDRQHPHDAFMELSATYSRSARPRPVGLHLSRPAGRTGARPRDLHAPLLGHGEPRGADLAPLARQHAHDVRRRHRGPRLQGPEAGGSVFTGREPDENRWDIERPRMDSWSVRATVNPTANLSRR